MTPDDKALHDTLDLLSQVVASVSDRLDRQGETLASLAKAQAQDGKSRAGDPNYMARATAEAVRRALVPELHKIVDAMEALNGTKAMLRQRLRAVEREEARQGRWRVQPWAVVLGIPLLLVTMLALTVPRAVAQTPLTCRATGGTWWAETDQYPAACLFPKRLTTVP